MNCCLRRAGLGSLFVTAAIMVATPVMASGLVRYVSSVGDNANNCFLATPCRVLQVAINRTPTGGEVRVLDSGNFGVAATVARGISVSGARPDVTLSKISLTINSAGGNVALRNLQLAGGGAVSTGISINAADSVAIENVVVQGYLAAGIVTNAYAGQLLVVDTTARSNRGFGLSVGASGTKVTIKRSRFLNNDGGGALLRKAVSSITDSEASGNGLHGFSVSDGTATIAGSQATGNNDTGFYVLRSAVATITRSQALGNTNNGVFVSVSSVAAVESVAMHSNGTGLSAGITSSVRLSGSTIVGNGTGVSIVNSSVYSRENNTIQNNTTNISGTLLTYSAQ